MKQKCCALWESGFVYKPRVTARSGVGYFSTWTRYSLNTDERTQNLEGNMENNAFENAVASNLEDLVLL